jgi:hypothetical protein
VCVLEGQLVGGEAELVDQLANFGRETCKEGAVDLTVDTLWVE